MITSMCVHCLPRLCLNKLWPNVVPLCTWGPPREAITFVTQDGGSVASLFPPCRCCSSWVVPQLLERWDRRINQFRSSWVGPPFCSWVGLVLFVVLCCRSRVAPSCCLQLASSNCWRGGVFRSRSGWVESPSIQVAVGSGNHVFPFQELWPTQFPLVERLGQSNGARPTEMSREIGGKFSQTKESQIVRIVGSHFPRPFFLGFPQFGPIAQWRLSLTQFSFPTNRICSCIGLVVFVVRCCSPRVVPFDGEVGSSGTNPGSSWVGFIFPIRVAVGSGLGW